MGISNFFNSLFGKAKVTADETIDKAAEFAAEAKVSLEDLAESASKKIDELHLSEKTEDFIKSAKEKLDEASEWADEKSQQAKEAFEDIIETVEPKMEELKKDTVKRGLSSIFLMSLL